MNYTPEQFAQAVLVALEQLNGPDLSKLSLEEKKELAENSNTPPEALIILAKDKNWNIRYRVAQNSNTPPEALIILAKDEDLDVRLCVAENSNTPPEALMILAKDKERSVRYCVENNPSSTREIIQTKRAFEYFLNKK